MAQQYTGLPPALKQAVFARDGYRCRWCGVTNSSWGYDAHHIQYRRGYSYDTLENLITLCRQHHNLVHDSYLIPKPVAQEILAFLISEDGAGTTGMAVMRTKQMEAKTDEEPNGPVGRMLNLD